jgi:predicted O-methyltransferase YrrM
LWTLAGAGALVAAILARHPGVRAVLFDLPHVVADARGFIKQAGFAARCELVGGSFFDTVPAGGDAYLLKSVLHDWYDADVKRILQVCHAAMRPDAVLLVIERLLAPPTKGPRASLGTSICWLRQVAVRGRPRNGRRRCVPAVSGGEASRSWAVPR